jgi:hypothetical protein
MPRRVHFFIFSLLILTAGTSAVAQSHAPDPKSVTPVKHVPAEPAAPAPAATARAVARALTDAQAQRKLRRGPRRDPAVVPPEKRWQLVWSTGSERVELVWPPPARVPVIWPAEPTQ